MKLFLFVSSTTTLVIFFCNFRRFGAGPIHHKYKKLGIRVASRVAELLKICDLGKLQKNRKISNLGGDIA